MDHQALLSKFRQTFHSATSTIVMHWAHRSEPVSDELFGNSTSGLAMLSESPGDFHQAFDKISHPHDG
jgi:hypothetical protein